MEYQKFACCKHPNQEINIFCLSPSCLQGLCPTCLCEHTSWHIKSGTSPTYQNIKATQARYVERIREQMVKIGNSQEWLSLIKEKIDEQTENVHLLLAKARKDCINLVGKYFDSLQEKVMAQILQENKKNGLHNTHRFDTINYLLSKQFDDLLTTSTCINSSKFLEVVQFLERDILPSCENFHAQISKQLKQNEIYSTGIVYRAQLLPEIQSSLKKVINLEFILPKVQLVTSSFTTKIQAKSERNKQNFSLILPKKSSVLRKKGSIESAMPNISTPVNMTPTSSRKNSQIHGFINNQELYTIRQTKRQDNQQIKSLKDSVSRLSDRCSKLAYSTYCDEESNIFR